MFGSFKTGLEPLLEKLGMSQIDLPGFGPGGPYRTPAPPRAAAPAAAPTAAPRRGLLRRAAGPLAAVGLGAGIAGLAGYGAMNRHEDDVQRDGLVYSPLGGMG